MRSARVTALVMCTTVIAGCSAGGRLESGSTRPDVDAFEPVFVEVANQNLSEAAIVLLLGPERRRLGYVLPQSSAQFTVPGRYLVTGREVRLHIELTETSVRASTETIVAWPGQHVMLRVEPDVRLSNIHVR